jgi:hypothetical protein
MARESRRSRPSFVEKFLNLFPASGHYLVGTREIAMLAEGLGLEVQELIGNAEAPKDG